MVFALVTVWNWGFVVDQFACLFLKFYMYFTVLKVV